MSSTKQANCTFTCSPAAKERVLEALRDAANDSRLNGVVILAPKGIKSMQEGQHSLTEVLKTLEGSNTTKDNGHATSSILGDVHCSSLEVLERCYSLMKAMAETEWLQGSEVKIEGDNEIFIEGTHDFVDTFKVLAQLTKNAFIARMDATPHLCSLGA